MRRTSTHQVTLFWAVVAVAAIVLPWITDSRAETAQLERVAELQADAAALSSAGTADLSRSVDPIPSPVPQAPSSPHSTLAPGSAARPKAPLGGPLKISAPMVAGGDVLAVLVNANGSTAVYAADQDVNDVVELYSVPVTGGTAVQLNAPLVAGGNVLALAVSSDGTRVVYRADQDADTVEELYSVPVGGGTATKINGALVVNGDVQAYGISPDSSRVIYIADQTTDTVNELYSVPIGGGTAIKISGPMVLNGDVATFGLNLDRAVYRADQITDTVDELFSVLITGGTVTKLNPTPVLNGDVGGFIASGGRAYYFADQDTDAKIDFYSVPNTGGTSVKLNGPLVAGGNVTQAFIGTTRVGYVADQDANDVFEVYIVPTTGGTPIKLNPALVAGGDVQQIALTSNDTVVLYRADQDADEVIEFYSVPASGGASLKLNAALVPGGDTLNFAVAAGGTFPTRALYFADQDADEVIELYGVSPSGSPTKLNSALVAGGDLTSVVFNVNGLMAYRADQDADEVFEIYSRTTTGVGPVTKLNFTPILGGDVTDLRFGGVFPASVSVVYLADQDVNDVVELYTAFLDGDADGDAIADGADCLAYDGSVWAPAGEVAGLLLSHTGGVGGTTTLSWSADPGGPGAVYDTVSSPAANDFVTSATCVETDDGSDTSATDSVTPASEAVSYFLVRAENVCGIGSLGTSSGGSPRTARTCP